MERRQFLKIAGGSAGALAVAGGAWMLKPKTRRAVRRSDVNSFCEMCFWKCGITARVEDGRVVKLDGLAEHPLSRGRLCPRGNGGTGLLYDPDRLRTPLIRTGKRGTQYFREATWEEALDYVASRMDAIRTTHGPESMALFTHGSGSSFFVNLMKAYGSPNFGAPAYAQCQGPREVGFQLTYGMGVGEPEATDIANTRFLVLIGSHLGENMHNTQVQEFADALRRGAKVAVVDPRFSTAAGKADWYLPIKPGTDIALLLAWMNVLIQENLYDREYVEAYGSGFDRLKQITANDTPEWAAGITEIPAEMIRTVAREMAKEKPSVLIHPGRHTTWYGDDTQRSRAIALLNALLGSWGRPGGFYFPSGANVPALSLPPYPKPALARADGSGSVFPLADQALTTGLRNATVTGKPYPLEGWLVYDTNLLQSLPNPRETEKAIQSLELLAVVDVLPAEITGYADVVLPECTYLERYDDLYAGTFREPFVALRQPAVEPMYNTRPGWWIARELGRRLGLGAYFPWDNIEDYLDRRLKGISLSLAEMKKSGVVTFASSNLYIKPGHQFDTPSKKIEFFSTTLEQMGVDPVPRYYAHEEPPPGYLRLLYGRLPMHSFGRSTNNPVLGSLAAENEVWISEATAAQFAVKPGQEVRLVNQDGVRSDPVRAKITKRIRADCVFLAHGFGHHTPRMRLTNGRGASDSDLITRYKTDVLMGATGMNVNFVTIEEA